ncbi:MAG: S41 family peptidase [Bacteroidales bacterium]|jgi:carboxyl-terminal processing protease|nr:S41 family peptidase [Bacteroidales bacterium]
MKKHLVSIFITFLATIAVPLHVLPQQAMNEDIFKFGRTLGLIDSYYVDTANLKQLTEKAIVEMLRSLDPHSTYISAEDVKEMNEPLNGNFDGIGIQFNILRDTILVVEPVAGGPSEKVGLRAGDRIVQINREQVAGIGITTSAVRKKLMGARGTKVNVSVYRRGQKELLDFVIIRDKIPINSLDAAYMLNAEVGYIKLNKFAATTEEEFSTAVTKLQAENMQHLVLDLRSNGGGYMLAATQIAGKFFADRKLLVYLSGRKTARQNYGSSGNGNLASARVVVLTDENSASASEILSGALQDWDRGVIIGRRTFGKGLVQNGFNLTDGSMIRLTIARYYTPSGRSIQSPYDSGYDKYMENFFKRYTDGEMLSADSIRIPDTLKYSTLVNKRTVYGGGGITPDVFVAIDTTYDTQYMRRLAGKNLFNTFALEYFDRNRAQITGNYKVFDDFKDNFRFSEEDIKDFIAKGEAEGVKYDDTQFNTSKEEILLILKGLVSMNLWQTSEYFQIIYQNDKTVEKALQVISDEKTYNELLGNRQQ